MIGTSKTLGGLQPHRYAMFKAVLGDFRSGLIQTRLSHLRKYSSTQASFSSGSLDDDHDEARRWLRQFHVNTIPRTLCEISFSRSSGPGGQNVNK